MRLVSAICFCVLLGGCASSSTQSVGPCEKYSAHDFWSSDTAMICHDSSGKVVGMVGSGSADSPSNLMSSSANAAVLGAAIPLGAALITAPSASAAAAAAATGKTK